MQMRTMLGRVRGLGSAKAGVHHWWAQRMTALALIPLTLWFVASVISLAGADHAAVVAWIGHPFSGTLMVLLIAATFYHASLGLQVVVEDYVHSEGVKIAVLLALKAVLIGLGVASVLSVLRLVLGR